MATYKAEIKNRFYASTVFSTVLVSASYYVSLSIFIQDFFTPILPYQIINQMALQFKIEASKDGKTGTIRLVDYISMATNSSADTIRDIVDDFIQKEITAADVYINCRGGSTIEAVEIGNELNRIPNVVITVGAVAASAATYLVAKFKTKAYSNSQFMIHRPQLSTRGDINHIKADLKLLENTNQDYKQAYAKKMKKTPDEIESLFEKGDYWMTAAEALDLGLIDEIINSDSVITAEDVEILTACGAPIVPKIPEKEKTETETEIKMKNRNQIISILKLSADATDEAIEAAIAQNATTSAEVSKLKEIQASALQTTVNQMIDKAILDKKITADVKETYVKLGISDLESTKAILEAMPVLTKPSAELETDKTEASNREKWTLDDYIAKDPKALDKMMIENPTRFAELEAGYFGS